MQAKFTDSSMVGGGAGLTLRQLWAHREPQTEMEIEDQSIVGYVLEAKGTRVSVAAREPGSHIRCN